MRLARPQRVAKARPDALGVGHWAKARVPRPLCPPSILPLLAIRPFSSLVRNGDGLGARMAYFTKAWPNHAQRRMQLSGARKATTDAVALNVGAGTQH